MIDNSRRRSLLLGRRRLGNHGSLLRRVVLRLTAVLALRVGRLRLGSVWIEAQSKGPFSVSGFSDTVLISDPNYVQPGAA